MTRNKKYEKKLMDQGLVKMTLWVPIETKQDFWNMAKECCEVRGIYPVACRDKKTGKFHYVR